MIASLAALNASQQHGRRDCNFKLLQRPDGSSSVQGGTGNLVKCFIERIVEDTTGGELECPSCGVQFARRATIRGRPAHKMVGGKVFFQK
jgi:hypothetical protein